MLILWRRHTRKCPHASREFLKCRCPIWIDWTTEGKRIRKPLNLRDWQAAQLRARHIEAEGLGTHNSVNTIDKAMEQFEVYLTKQRNVREPTLRKYKFLFRRLREFCWSRGLIFLNQLSAEEASTFRNTWTLGPLTHVKQLERLKAFFRFCVDME